MANKVLLKRSSVANKIPATGDLEYGELAINYTDEKLYFKNASNAIKSFESITTTISDTAPTTPKKNDKWIDTSSGIEYFWYVDSDSGQWVETGPTGISPSFIHISNTPPDDTGLLWVDTSA